MNWKNLTPKVLTAGVLLAAGLGAGLAIAHDGDHPTDLTPSRADPTFIAVLNGGQAVPPTTSPGMGVALLTMDRKTGELRYNLTVSGLEGAITNVHIHAGATGEVRKPQLFVLAGTGGVYNGSVGQVDKHVQRLLKRGQCYFNVHSDLHTPGEIRGQIMPVKGVR